MPLRYDMTRGKISGSLDRIMQSKYKNRDYAEIHSERLKQRSLEKEFYNVQVDPYYRQREEFVQKYHKYICAKPIKIQNSQEMGSSTHDKNNFSARALYENSQNKSNTFVKQSETNSLYSKQESKVKNLKNKKSKLIMLKPSKTSKVSPKQEPQTSVRKSKNKTKRNYIRLKTSK